METAQITSLRTERLLLHILTPEVYKLIFTSYSDEQIKDFFGLHSDEALLVEKNKYTGGLVTWNRSLLNFRLTDKQTGRVIGGCGYHTWYLQHNRAEIGYAINDDADKGKGLMKEALRSIIPYGFREMNLNRIEAFVGGENIPSLKLMERFGFKEEGRLRAHYCKNGRPEDSIVFSILKNEYDPPGSE